MRIFLALLAMITGLSFPQVAVAISRAEVAEAGMSAQAAAMAAKPQQRCICRGGEVPQKRTNARRKTVWLPAPALIRPSSIYLSDRARK
ncbi:MAG: hypothetical protein B7Y36_02665 [Novosphingobium sp. 28-62-57]|uniref:hypothetical protein n=1 Tax=unclassified Novosphingobium TaxID=2644732 RepID=UPI000BC502CD|nr:MULTISPECIES: hypothetical protein [unclassified Novosphingobium]OYW49607.1 MAG: hypothetical protein B7Z34_07945 [Novosphingobium sp. 12-62-10]OYZ12437.1 MAG: hypothetical protein B7Y36_02665 [Novosphingobium sp. 28-62-57]OZA30258.1 MAG: hypothetical protein B7X92_16200 [Novosphingobium sp. 17-62-9]HQS68426.1 hypothetical protein [Novosphingobium sp.]